MNLHSVNDEIQEKIRKYLEYMFLEGIDPKTPPT